jgi:translation initiation factor RLI1
MPPKKKKETKNSGKGGDDTPNRIAVVSEERCKPKKCKQECKVYCPVNKIGKLCIEVTPATKIAFISEELCIGCGICVKKCPFDAIQIINLPSNLENQTTHRYGANSFKLHRLPTPRPGQVRRRVLSCAPRFLSSLRHACMLSLHACASDLNWAAYSTECYQLMFGGAGQVRALFMCTLLTATSLASLQVLGLVGTNGIGKSTALKILSGKLKPNLGKFNDLPEWETILAYFRGSELQNYFTRIVEEDLKATLKPQYVDHIPRAVRGSVEEVRYPFTFCSEYALL